VVGIVSWVLIAVMGAITGISVLRGRMSMRAAAISWVIRVGMAVGVVFVMTVKPGWLVASIAVIAGALVGLAGSRVAVRQVESA